MLAVMHIKSGLRSYGGLRSYNWTDNASEHNDENIEIIQDWNNANIGTRQFLNDWNK